mmetsp:Transcript_46306/g.140430  ORF Transcript_46306/g.140430 Transcript_46306/m.140430 type:complete len:261 (+) Transcript_46306:605-1387(+)
MLRLQHLGTHDARIGGLGRSRLQQVGRQAISGPGRVRYPDVRRSADPAPFSRGSRCCKENLVQNRANAAGQGIRRPGDARFAAPLGIAGARRAPSDARDGGPVAARGRGLRGEARARPHADARGDGRAGAVPAVVGGPRRGRADPPDRVAEQLCRARSDASVDRALPEQLGHGAPGVGPKRRGGVAVQAVAGGEPGRLGREPPQHLGHHGQSGSAAQHSGRSAGGDRGPPARHRERPRRHARPRAPGRAAGVEQLGRPLG